MVSVKPRIPVTWMSDDRSNTGKLMCHSDFSMLNRRHHCRSCGSIFCHYCCYQYQSLPSYLPSTHKRYCDGKKHRVCNMCLREIIHVKKNKDIIMVFSLLRISLKQIVYLRTICKRWKLAIDTIIGVLKSLHLKIGYQRWTSIERRLISIHWKEFTGHSRLMVQAIRAMVGVSDITDMMPLQNFQTDYQLYIFILPCRMYRRHQCLRYHGPAFLFPKRANIGHPRNGVVGRTNHIKNKE